MELSQAQIDMLIEQSKKEKENYQVKIIREELRFTLISFMYYVKGSLTLEQLNAINAWVDHSNLNADEILKKLGED